MSEYTIRKTIVKRSVKECYVVLLFVLLTIFSCSDDKQENNDVIKITFICVGPVSDWGFNYSHNQARLFLEANHKNRIETRMIEQVPENEQLERVLEGLIQDGTKYLFLTSFGYLDPSIKNAKKHKEVIYMHCGGYLLAENFGTYAADLDEPFYLSGMAAGGMSETNLLGFIGAQPIPHVIKHINAFTLGAQLVNPNIKVHVVFTNSWNDPAKEAESASTLIAMGCDVIAGHVDSPIAYVQVAERNGKYSIGCHADLREFAPNGWLTGPIWRWGPLYEKIVISMLDGTWKSEHIRGGLAEGYVDIAQFGWQMSFELKERITRVRKEFENQSRQVFQGRIISNANIVKLQDGENATREFKESMDWFVKGVIGSN